MTFGSDLVRLAVALAATAVVLYRLAPRILVRQSHDQSPLALVQNIASMLAFTGALWVAASLTLRASARIVWAGIALALCSSFSYLTIYLAHRVLGRAPASAPQLDSPGAPRRKPIPESRVVASMVLILAISAGLAALRVEAWFAAVPFLMLAVGAWVTLVVVAWRTRGDD